MTIIDIQELSGRVCWHLGNLDFELLCGNESLARDAGRLFAYWPKASARTIGDDPVTIAIKASVVQGGFSVTYAPDREAKFCPDIESAVQFIETVAIGAVLRESRSNTTVHGALLARDGKGLLVVGPSFSGKSTLACGMSTAGWALLCDDVTVLHCGQATAAPVPRRISVRSPSREILGELFWQEMRSSKTCIPTEEGFLFHPGEIDNDWSNGTFPLGAIVFLNRLGAPIIPPAKVARMIPVAALMSLTAYTNVIRDEGPGAAIKKLEPLINQVPAYDMARGSLTDMISSLSGLWESHFV